MTKPEIALTVVSVASMLAIIVLAFRNRALARGQKLWMDVATVKAPQQPLPPAADMIKVANFDRATASREARIKELETKLAATQRLAESEHREVSRWMQCAQERGIRLQQLQGVEAKLAASEEEARRVAGLYMEAESQRQRLAMENNRLRGTVN